MTIWDKITLFCGLGTLGFVVLYAVLMEVHGQATMGFRLAWTVAGFLTVLFTWGYFWLGKSGNRS